MQRTALALGLIGVALAVVLSAVALTTGAVSTATGSDTGQLFTIGWGTLIFAGIGAVGCALMGRRPKLAVALLVLSGVFSGFASMPFLLIAALLTLLASRRASVAPAEITTSAQTPPRSASARGRARSRFRATRRSPEA